jgi:RimJ/RimL family protein N-acetyltransferase
MATITEKIYQLRDGRTVKIRSALERDAEAYLTLGKSIMAEEIYTLTQPHELNFTIEQEVQWIKLKIDNESHLVLVAEVDGEVIGQLDFSNGHRQRIAHTGDFGMGVRKDFRGMGIGSLLLRNLIDWAKDHAELEKINLCVHQTNDRAISTYKKLGFQIEGLRTKDLKYPNGVYVDTVLMGLLL